jgi:hypothetical protein
VSAGPRWSLPRRVAGLRALDAGTLGITVGTVNAGAVVAIAAVPDGLAPAIALAELLMLALRGPDQRSADACQPPRPAALTALKRK